SRGGSFPPGALRPGGAGRPVYGKGVPPPGAEPEGGGRSCGTKPLLLQPSPVPSEKGHLPGAAANHPNPSRLPPAHIHLPVDSGNRRPVRVSQCQPFQPGFQKGDGNHTQSLSKPKKQKGGQRRERLMVKPLPRL